MSSLLWYWRITANTHQPSTHHLCCVPDTSYVSACSLLTRVLTLELHLLKKPPATIKGLEYLTILFFAIQIHTSQDA